MRISLQQILENINLSIQEIKLDYGLSEGRAFYLLRLCNYDTKKC